jgi:hypothetical protein
MDIQGREPHVGRLFSLLCSIAREMRVPHPCEMAERTRLHTIFRVGVCVASFGTLTSDTTLPVGIEVVKNQTTSQQRSEYYSYSAVG